MREKKVARPKLARRVKSPIFRAIEAFTPTRRRDSSTPGGCLHSVLYVPPKLVVHGLLGFASSVSPEVTFECPVRIPETRRLLS